MMSLYPQYPYSTSFQAVINEAGDFSLLKIMNRAIIYSTYRRKPANGRLMNDTNNFNDKQIKRVSLID
jgi:hypothetical protein